MSLFNELILFGGAFDPPHSGHVSALEEMKKRSNGATVVALPSFGNPIKTTETSFEHRFQMASLAFQNIVPVWPTEKEHQFKATWQVLEYFLPKAKHLTFVIGTDQLKTFEKWSRFPEVLKMAHWTVIIRKPNTIENISSDLKKLLNLHVIESTSNPREYQVVGSPRTFRLMETEAPDISSTWVREKLALNQQQEILKFIPQGVYDYIERNHLYGI